MTASRKVCLAQVTGAHGVRGEVRLRVFADDPKLIAKCGPLSDAKDKQSYKATLKGVVKNEVIAALSGVTDRNTAQAMKGVELFVERSQLPKTGKREYYHADLVGLPAATVDGKRLGKVAALHNFGAGAVLEVELKRGNSVMFPFTDRVVPVVDLDAGTVVIDPPVGWLDDTTDKGAPS
jgi:16S rRNA processing protein RimM